MTKNKNVNVFKIFNQSNFWNITRITGIFTFRSVNKYYVNCLPCWRKTPAEAVF